jgi:sulfatase maturation enzyme AslB (radical SAM superfamily)
MIKMPWNNQTAPNVMVEVTDACNLKCQACYKKHGTSFKSLEQIQRDLETGSLLRPLHTVTISGGEPTLHPDLCRIITLVKKQKVHVFLLTNGVILNREYLQRLKESGLDSILFHVDSGQHRPDLPPNPEFRDIKIRLSELAGMAASCGLDVSVSATLYGNDLGFLKNLSDFVFSAPEITFLFASRGVNPATFTSSEPLTQHQSHRDPPTLDADTIKAFFEKEYGIEPFAYIPAASSNRISWFSYFIPVVYGQRTQSLFKIRSNRADLWMMNIHKLFKGRYIHKTTQAPKMTFLRVTINALTTCRPLSFARFLTTLASPMARLRHKIIAYDVGPVRLPNGRVEHCEYCPTAIVRDQSLIPCCVADYTLTEHGGFRDP